jgi:ABC-type polysaccharide/polyol phosphate export permease
MSWFVERLRTVLMVGDYSPSWSDLIVPAVVMLVCLVGIRFFRRMSGHFEDFL